MMQAKAHRFSDILLQQPGRQRPLILIPAQHIAGRAPNSWRRHAVDNKWRAVHCLCTSETRAGRQAGIERQSTRPACCLTISPTASGRSAALRWSALTLRPLHPTVLQHQRQVLHHLLDLHKPSPQSSANKLF